MKIIMIDAFKSEYLRYAPYLSSLTKKFQWGEVKMPLGFEGGMKTFFYGKNDILAFFYKSENSSLKWTKKFWWIGRLPLEILINLQRLLKRERLFRTGNIPLKKLYQFDTEIKKPFEKIKGIDYLYIGDIDKIAHKHGTKSKETIETIMKIDKMLSKIKFDIILSDHGMMDITKTISVPRTKDCMIDSTFARYWGEKPNFETKDGKWIEWEDKKYGEHIFLANPGVLILPNYWQGSYPVKAMHGYSPSCKEMNAFYILNKEGKKEDISINQLNEIFRKKMVLNNDRNRNFSTNSKQEILNNDRNRNFSTNKNSREFS